jgi:hypothetical protein
MTKRRKKTLLDRVRDAMRTKGSSIVIVNANSRLL